MAPGERIRALRTALDLSQQQLAERSGIRHRELIAHNERGFYKSTGKLFRERIARGFGLSVDALSRYLDGDLSLKDAVAQSKARRMREAS